MTIDVNKVLEAQQTIEEAKKELMLFVKQYFEDEAPKEAIFTENSRVNNQSSEIEVEIKTEKLSLKVKFSEFGKVWKYSITCDELGIHCLYPPDDNELAIQGKINVELKEHANILIGGENTQALVRYRKTMKMRKCSG